MAALELRFQLTSPITLEPDKLKWVTKHVPTGYDNTIKNDSMKLCQEIKIGHILSLMKTF